MDPPPAPCQPVSSHLLRLLREPRPPPLLGDSSTFASASITLPARVSPHLTPVLVGIEEEDLQACSHKRRTTKKIWSWAWALTWYCGSDESLSVPWQRCLQVWILLSCLLFTAAVLMVRLFYSWIWLDLIFAFMFMSSISNCCISQYLIIFLIFLSFGSNTHYDEVPFIRLALIEPLTYKFMLFS